MPKPPTTAPTNDKVKKEAAAVAPPLPAEGQLPVVYPELKATLYVGSQAVTCAEMKAFLGWETEKDYKARMKAARPDLTDAELEFGDQYTLKNRAGDKVKCWNIAKNRPFKESWARSMGQDILNRNWAGELTIEGETEHVYSRPDGSSYTCADGTVISDSDLIALPAGTINGEAFIIGRTGEVLSGQHRGIGFVDACERWAAEVEGGHWHRLWPAEPVLETLGVFGVAEHPKVIQTLDNVMPRSEGDVIYTSPIFADIADRNDKRECSRMLARAVDTLWDRTGAGDPKYNIHNQYRTHSEAVGLRERHPKILELLRYVLDLNKKGKHKGSRGVSLATNGASPGGCAGLLYLMGASATDGPLYRAHEPQPSEDAVDWKNWTKAREFWKLLADNDKQMIPVRAALAKLVDATPSSEDNAGLGGRQVEKNAVLSKAWCLFAAGKPITAAGLKLDYRTNTAGVPIGLEEWPSCGGIDLGDPHAPTPDESAPTPEEIGKEKDALVEAARKKIEEAKVKAPTGALDKALEIVKNGHGKVTVPAKPGAKPAANVKPAATKPKPSTVAQPRSDGGKKATGNRGPR